MSASNPPTYVPRVRMPADRSHLEPQQVDYGKIPTEKRFGVKLADDFCSNGKLDIKVVDRYGEILTSTKNRRKQPDVHFAESLNCLFNWSVTTMGVHLFGLHGFGKNGTRRIFMPCYSGEHVFLLIIESEMEPPTIKVFDPVPGDQRFNVAEHNIIQVLNQHFHNHLSVKFELTHINNLPYEAEISASGLIVMEIMKLFSQRPPGEEDKAMKRLLSWEHSLDAKGEREYIEKLQKTLYNELFIARKIL